MKDAKRVAEVKEFLCENCGCLIVFSNGRYCHSCTQELRDLSNFDPPKPTEKIDPATPRSPHDKIRD